MSKPNSKLWENYESFGCERGRMVSHILAKRINMQGAAVLDFGCGRGDIALELAAAGAQVIAFDENSEKTAHLKNEVQRLHSTLRVVERAPKVKNYFDAVVLLDVIEHLTRPAKVLHYLFEALKPDGIIYISTPNKLSPINVLCDPHFSLPFVALFSRSTVRFVVATVLGWQPRDRIDFPQLFQLNELWRLAAHAGLQLEYINGEAAEYAFRNPHAVWNRDSHLKMIQLLKKMGGIKVVERYLSDSPDFFNRWINPTWFMIAKKNPDVI